MKAAWLARLDPRTGAGLARGMVRGSVTFFGLAHLARLGVVLALVLVSLVPQGFMPQRNADGQMVVVLCTPDGPVEMSLDQPAPGDDEDNRPSPCQWHLAGIALPPLPPLTLPRPATGTETLAATAAPLWRPGHDPRGIWARGPPLPV